MQFVCACAPTYFMFTISLYFLVIYFTSFSFLFLLSILFWEIVWSINRLLIKRKGFFNIKEFLSIIIWYSDFKIIFSCDVPGCGKTYTNASRLKRHALSHVKGRYPCSYEGCLHKMDTYTELRHHIRSAHPKSKFGSG